MALLAVAPAVRRRGANQESTVLVAIFNNLPELLMGAAWTGLVFWAGRRWERRFPKKAKQPGVIG